tara:strand:- start:10230 stop:11147 length:918 start_codon:yes stop_codon:yes gene_type:complete
LIKPGKVSRDFIDGKRNRYSNPFQFYLTVSIVFFLILGMADKYNEFDDFRNGRKENKGSNIVNINTDTNKQKIDSVIKGIDFEDKLAGLDSIERAKTLAILNQVKDTITSNNLTIPDFEFNNDKGALSKMIAYQKEHSEYKIDDALDSLQLEKNFWNRFKYSRVNKINAFIKNTDDENKKFMRELISYASISIFIFLPIFTLFLSFIYIRRKFTYVEHLIFVFHTQTVFFILLTIFFSLGLITHNENITWVFIVLFLAYLLIAMKRFYQQGYFKTLVKLCMLNTVFFIMAGIGFAIMSAITFAMY